MPIVLQGYGGGSPIFQGFGSSSAPPPSGLPMFCTVADLEDFLHLTITDTAEATRAIEGATAAIQRYCNQYLAEVVGDVVTFRTAWQNLLILPEQPVTAVASVVESAVTLVNDTDYVWSDSGIIYRTPRGQRWPADFGTVVVTYSHGYATIPQIIREVCIRSASRAFQSGLRAAVLAGVPGVASEQLPDYQVSLQPDTAGGGASSLGASAAPFLLPSEQAMLNPYRMKP